MFGYHDSNRCEFDLWSPTKANEQFSPYADPHQPGYGVWEDTPYHTAVENRAFSPYAQHSQDVEDVIKLIGSGVLAIECETDMSQSDLDYIKKEVRRRYGLEANLSF